jgi:hypothetical protein
MRGERDDAPRLDLGSVFAASDVTIAPSERDDERAARIVKESRAALWADIRSMILFFVVLVAVIALAVLCGHLVFFDKTAAPETQKWAQTALTALVSGGVAFLFGRSTAASGSK